MTKDSKSTEVLLKLEKVLMQAVGLVWELEELEENGWGDVGASEVDILSRECIQRARAKVYLILHDRGFYPIERDEDD